MGLTRAGAHRDVQSSPEGPSSVGLFIGRFLIDSRYSSGSRCAFPGVRGALLDDNWLRGKCTDDYVQPSVYRESRHPTFPARSPTRASCLADSLQSLGRSSKMHPLSNMTYTVTSPADALSGGTLRQAIILANANPGNNTIVFALSRRLDHQPDARAARDRPRHPGRRTQDHQLRGRGVTIDASGNGSNIYNVDKLRAAPPLTSTGQIFVIDATSGNVQIAGSASQTLTLPNATTIASPTAVPSPTSAPTRSTSPTSCSFQHGHRRRCHLRRRRPGGREQLARSARPNVDFNAATGDGGAIYTNGTSSLTVNNSSFGYNRQPAVPAAPSITAAATG